MTTAQPEPEGPEDINPDHLADGKRAEVLLRNPGVAQVNDDGSRTELAPNPRWLEWGPVPLIADPANCRHGFSMCAECADEWGIDHYIRFWSTDPDGSEHVVWLSPDHPDHP